ncbi:Dabb family protein [Sphingomonas psychrotolerans]|nr:Dabb family protein [Sphingomonas psychrotolerans]
MSTAQLYHVVVYRLADGLNPEKCAQMEALFARCRDEIPEILDIEFGHNVSVSRFARGWEYGAVMTMAGPAERDRFLTHPTHLQLSAAAADGFYREVVVFDLPIAGTDAGETA